MREETVARLALHVARALLHAVSDMLPDARREWGLAVDAELAAIPEPAARLRFAISAAAGMSGLVLREAARGRVADPGLVATALGIGVAAAVTDLSVTSRVPAAALVGAACLALGARVARAAWRWPLLIGGMLPLGIAVSGDAGPYAHDRGDQWYLVSLALLSTLIGLAARAAVLALRTSARDRTAR